MIAAGVETMKELGGRSPSVIASMTFMTMLHVTPWRPDFDECEQARNARSATRPAVMIDRCSIIASDACSTHLRWHAAMGGMHASSKTRPCRAFDPRRLGAGPPDLPPGPLPPLNLR